MQEEKQSARLLQKEQEAQAKTEVENNLLPAFQQAIIDHEIVENVHVKNLQSKLAKHSLKFTEKAASLSHFLHQVLPELVENINKQRIEEAAAAAEAVVAAEVITDYLQSQKFHDSVKSLCYGHIHSSGLSNLDLAKTRANHFDEIFTSTFGSSPSDLKAIYLSILHSPNVSHLVKALLPHFNVASFKEVAKGESAHLHDFVGKLLVIMSFLTSASSIQIILKGSSAINYYAHVDSLDLDFGFYCADNTVSSEKLEKLSCGICFFLIDLFCSYFERRASFCFDHGSFKDENNYCCTLKFNLLCIADKINCSRQNRVTNRVSGLPLIDFNFGSRHGGRFRETKYSLVYNKQTGSLSKIDKANRERNSTKPNLIFGYLNLPTIESLIEERVYFLTVYSQQKPDINFDTLEKDVTIKRDPILFYICKTMKQTSVLLRANGENSSDTLRSAFASVQRHQSEFPDFETVSIFQHIIS
jgi:hypothetical protein